MVLQGAQVGVVKYNRTGMPCSDVCKPASICGRAVQALEGYDIHQTVGEQADHDDCQRLSKGAGKKGLLNKSWLMRHLRPGFHSREFFSGWRLGKTGDADAAEPVVDHAADAETAERIQGRQPCDQPDQTPSKNWELEE